MRNARRFRRRTVQVELLEVRRMLTADYLYSLTPRPGVAADGFGWSHAASDDYHVVGNPFLDRQPVDGFVGEVQVHDANSGALLRTIVNPDPGDLYRFGYSVDVFEDWIVVGAVGWGDRNTADTTVSGYSDRSGRAYLFEASTGNLVFTFDGTFTTGNPASENHDQFGESVSIDGNYVVVGAPGISPFGDGTLTAPDGDAGHAYIFSTVTGSLLNVLANPEPEAANPGAGLYDLDFGFSVATSNGKVVVGNPDTADYGDGGNSHTGKAYVYEASSGQLLHTLLATDELDLGESTFGSLVKIDGNVIAVLGSSTTLNGALTYVFDTATGSLTQTHEDLILSDVNGEQLASRVFVPSVVLTTFGSIVDAGSGTVLSTIPLPTGYDPETSTFLSTVTLFGNRLLVGEGVLPPGGSGDVFVYDTGTNAAPMDIALSGNTIAELAANSTVIGALTATDPTPGETLTFSLLNSAGGRFGLNGTNLVVADGSLLNFEAFASHSITVRVTDSANNTFDEVFTINVTDVNEAATLISLTPNIESENTTNNALVGSLSSNDPDNAETETFVLLDDAGGRFVQDGLQIRIADASLIDFETATSHQIAVRVTDSASHVFEQLVTINIADFNYIPTDIALSGNTVQEGAVSVQFSPTQAPQQSFGGYIAASGDRFIVGTSFAPVPGQAGQSHVYSRTTGLLTATLVSPFPQSGQFVPGEVAIDGNLAVMSGMVTTGGWAVHVFDVTTGGLLRTLTSPSTDTVQFGVHVAISGNLIAVSGTAAGQGHVFLFDAGNGTLLETLASPNPAGSSGFGTRVDISGNSIVVGDPVDQSSGVVFLYEYDSGTTAATLVTTLNNPSPNAGDFFGWHVERSDDLVAVSSTYDDTQATDSGLVYLFNATTGALLHTISNPTPGNGDLFGSELDLSADRLIVSTYWDDTLATDTGAAYVFDVGSGDLLATLQNPSPDPGDRFGSLAMAGNTILVGAFSDDTIGLNAGAVYRFDLPIAAVIGTLTGFDPEPTETFTWSLLDDSGGRFGIDGNNLVVADPTLLDYETAAAHDVTVQATDSGGLTFSKTFTIQVTNAVETSHLVSGTSGNDDFVLTYSNSIFGGTVSVTISTNGGPVTPIGTYPMLVPLILNGFAGTDTVTVNGTSGADLFAASSQNSWSINSASLGLSSIEARFLDLGAGNDQYYFDADTPLGLINVFEFSGGVDRISLNPTESVDVSVNLSLTGIQTVHPTNLSLQLGPANSFEQLEGGSGNDELIGNTLANTIFAGPGNDTITGAGGNDLLFGGTGDDAFVFNAVTAAEADYVAEYLDQGTDTITFASMPADVTMSLTSVATQPVHVGRTISLASAITVENLTGGAGNDVLRGNDLNNILTGGPGNDQLIGLGGSDSLSGGIGNDTYLFHDAANAEVDSIIELDNQGIGDLVNFLGVSSSGVTLDIGSIAVQTLHTNRMLQLASGNAIEALIGSPGNDVLTGNSLANTITGGSGNDVLRGGNGSDGLFGGAGNDSYVFDPASGLEIDFVSENANQGTDTLDFTSVADALSLNLSLTGNQAVHANRQFSMSPALAVENLIGGSGNDVLTGNTLTNTITGGPGNDTITGAGGSDSLFGGTGDDTFVFHAVTSAEADYVAEFSNQGVDTITFASMSLNLDVSLTTVAVQPVHTGRTLTLSSAITVENLIGGSGNDVLRGNNQNNMLVGNSGNDFHFGGSGSDTMIGGPGNDWYTFTPATGPEIDLVTEAPNGGIDGLSFVSVNDNITLSLASAFAQLIHTNRTLQLSSGTVVENVTTGFGNDVLIGNLLPNALNGSGGNDSISGAGGSDVLTGGFGDDTFLFGPAATAESDNIAEWFNQGTDTISFTTISEDIVFNASSISAQSIHSNRTLTLSSGITIENIIGGTGDDELRGNALANSISGGLGNDRLAGVDGSDSLIGGIGDDVYAFGDSVAFETETITELIGEGDDTLSFVNFTTTVTVSLALTSVQTFQTNRLLQLSSGVALENVLGSSAADMLFGNSQNNRLIGNGGDDVLVGQEGNDYLNGGIGRDILIGGLGADTIIGGADDDILIAGRTTSDLLTLNLADLRAEWISPIQYLTRINNLRSGIGVTGASLTVGSTALNDSSPGDNVTGDGGEDWYLAALDDLINDLVVGEVLDLL